MVVSRGTFAEDLALVRMLTPTAAGIIVLSNESISLGVREMRRPIIKNTQSFGICSYELNLIKH